MTEKLLEQYRETAVRDLTDKIEATRPHEFNAKLAHRMFVFMIDLMTAIEDVNDCVMFVEDVISRYDNDLSDYLMLKDYQLNTAVDENGGDPRITITLTYTGIEIFRMALTLSEARLMAAKKKISSRGA